VLLVQVLRQGAINAHRILGAVAVYILLGTIWSLFYHLIELQLPGAFQLPPGISEKPQVLQAHLGYFSFVTLTTLGYGDIVAVHPVSRTFVIIEALVGQLFPAILLARLVSMEIAHRGKSNAE
jgi:voltage-gated potassium channel Kch